MTRLLPCLEDCSGCAAAAVVVLLCPFALDATVSMNYSRFAHCANGVSFDGCFPNGKRPWAATEAKAGLAQSLRAALASLRRLGPVTGQGKD